MVSAQEDILKLTEKISSSQLPEPLADKVMGMVDRLKKLAETDHFLIEYEQAEDYLDWICNLPWNKETEDQLDLGKAKEILEKNHFGLNETKERILEYLSVLKLQQNFQKDFSRAPILCLVGLAGTGKTTLAKSIAEAMNRQFIRIPFGGLGDVLFLRGQSRAYDDAEPGQVIKSLRRVQSRNPVLLLDEIDRVDEAARASIMGALLELLDPEQNNKFMDHFIDYPFDLSQVLFVATCNNTNRIATAVLDRLEIIQMPSYTDEEKVTIAKNYVFPQMIKEFGINENMVTMNEEVWPKIVRPLGFDAGIRTLERTVQGVLRKIAKKIVTGEQQKFDLTLANINEFLPSY